MEFHQAGKSDLDAFLQIRLAMVASIRDIPDPLGFRESTRRYLETHIGGDDLVIWLATTGGIIASCCVACIFTSAPLARCLSGRSAELLNVFTLPEYRRQGLATRVIALTTAELRCRGVEKLLLEYTDAGLPLYQRLGFEPLERQMRLWLNDS